MEHERCRHLPIQGGEDCVEVLCSFGQNENLAALPVGISNFGGDGGGPCLINRKMPEHIRDAGL
mgnify:CR=1 FL=1